MQHRSHFTKEATLAFSFRKLAIDVLVASRCPIPFRSLDFVAPVKLPATQQCLTIIQKIRILG